MKVKQYPDDLLDKLIESWQFGQGGTYLYYAFRGFLDMAIFNQDTENFKSTGEIFDELLNSDRFKDIKEINPGMLRLSKEYLNKFKHSIAGLYDAGFYTYKYSLCMAAEILAKNLFADGSPLENNKGLELREKILEPGASKPAGEVYKNYMGTDTVNPEAFLSLIGA